MRARIVCVVAAAGRSTMLNFRALRRVVLSPPFRRPFEFMFWFVPPSPEVLSARVPLRCMRSLLMAGVVMGFAALIQPAVIAADVDSDDAETEFKPDRWISSIAPLGDGQWIAATADGLLLRPSDVVTFSSSKPTEWSRRYKQPTSIWAVATNPQRTLAASVDYRGNLAIFDPAAGTAEIYENAGGRWSRALCFTPDGKTLLIGNEIGELILWSTVDAKVQSKLKLIDSAIMSIVPMVQTKTPGWVIAGSGGEINVYDRQWSPLAATKIDKGPALSVAMRGNEILVGGADRQLQSFELKPTESSQPDGSVPEQTVDSPEDAKSDERGQDDPDPPADLPMTLQPAGVLWKTSDWVTAILVEGERVIAADMSGQVHTISVGGSQTVRLSSGVWALVRGGDALLAGTRRDGVVVVPDES